MSNSATVHARISTLGRLISSIPDVVNLDQLENTRSGSAWNALMSHLETLQGSIDSREFRRAFAGLDSKYTWFVNAYFARSVSNCSGDFTTATLAPTSDSSERPSKRKRMISSEAKAEAKMTATGANARTITVGQSYKATNIKEMSSNPETKPDDDNDEDDESSDTAGASGEDDLPLYTICYEPEGWVPVPPPRLAAFEYGYSVIGAEACFECMWSGHHCFPPKSKAGGKTGICFRCHNTRMECQLLSDSPIVLAVRPYSAKTLPVARTEDPLECDMRKLEAALLTAEATMGRLELESALGKQLEMATELLVRRVASIDSEYGHTTHRDTLAIGALHHLDIRGKK